MQIPDFLAHLPRDAKGRPAPWLNLRGEEAAERMRVAHDDWVGMDAMFIDDKPGAEVNFRRMHPGRQREAMLRGVCSVCGRQILSWNRRVLVLSGVSVERIPYGGAEVPVVTEPWLHQRCAEYAVSVCPALIGRRRDEDLTVWPVSRPGDVSAFTSVGGSPHLPGTEEAPVAMWVKLAVRTVRLEPRPQPTDA